LRNGRNTIIVAVACALLGGCMPVRERVRAWFRSPAERLAEAVTIGRDGWGIPHIAGATDAAALFGLGYAHAEDAWPRVEAATIRALGRAAELYGPELLADDLVRAAFEVERHARAEYEREPPERRQLWDAYALGIEYYLETHAVPRRLARFEPWYVFARVRDVSAATVIDGVRVGAALWHEDGAANLQPARGDTAAPAMLGAWLSAASAAWAVAPARTADGHALLTSVARGPFQPTDRPYEFELRSDEGWHVAGLGLPGLPVPVSGHTARHAWTHTASSADVTDGWIVSFEPANPLSYRYDGGERQAVEWLDTIRVRTDTAVVGRVFHFRRTHHGPALTLPDGRTVAFRIARFEEGGALQQWLAMSRAEDLAAFTAALGLGAIPGASTLYADTAGNILYAHGGAVPRRDAALDRTVPANGAEARADWDGVHALDELPRVLNPPGGWLYASGNAPLAVTADEDLARRSELPAYLLEPPAAPPARDARALLARDTVWTAATMAAVPFDTRVALADSAIEALVYEWERLGAADPDRTMTVDAAVDSLRQWDRVGTVASVPMTLYVLWLEQLARPAAAEDEWPRIRALEAALAALNGAWGTADVAWGDINRLQRPRADGTFDAEAGSFPIAGAPPAAGIIFDFNTAPGPAGKLRFGVAGNSRVAVVELGPRVRGWAVDVFGRADDATSPHAFDQAPLYARGELRDVWFHADDVAAAVRRVYRPGPVVADSAR
jgi:acyl-homoserine-lactone acylase